MSFCRRNASYRYGGFSGAAGELMCSRAQFCANVAVLETSGRAVRHRYPECYPFIRSTPFGGDPSAWGVVIRPYTIQCTWAARAEKCAGKSGVFLVRNDAGEMPVQTRQNVAVHDVHVRLAPIPLFPETGGPLCQLVRPPREFRLGKDPEEVVGEPRIAQYPADGECSLDAE